MAYIVQSSLKHNYFVHVEDLDDITAWRAFSKLKDTRGMAAGIAVPPEVVPRRYAVTDKAVPVHGFFSCLHGKAIDDRTVAAVEAIEPGVHRFHPVEITMKADGRPLPRPQFLLNCCTSIEAIDPAHSKVKIKRVLPEETHPDLWYYARQMGGPLQLAVFRDKVAGRAMWWDNRFDSLFFSDALVAALQAAGVEGFDLSPHVAET